VTETQVIVGHDLDQEPSAANGNKFASAQEVAFGICSHPTVCQQTGGTLLDKWVHITVQRYQRGAAPNSDGSNTKWYHTYRVLVNGNILEIAQFPGGSRVPTEIDYDPGESSKVEGPRSGRTLPAVTCGTCSPLSSWNCGCMEKFARGTALIFGAYKGAVEPKTYFEGYIDEWRFWHGYRMVNEIVSNMRRQLNPDKTNSYGDPADPSFVVTQDKSTSRVSALMALWNFDQKQAATNMCIRSGYSNCELTELLPVFPVQGDPRLTLAGVQLYRAFGRNVVTSPTDDSGAMFYSAGGRIGLDYGNLTIGVNKPGLYQVMVIASLPGGAAKVPVDFIVSVVDAAWSEQGAYQLCPATSGVPCAYTGNSYMPLLTIYASVQQVATCSGRFVSPEKMNMRPVQTLLYPCSITAIAGFPVSLLFEGVDKQAKPAGVTTGTQPYDWRDTNVGFGMGPMPPTARFSAVHGTNPATMDFTWTPCQQDMGMITMCFEAVDNHIIRATGATAPKAASPMDCVQISVVPDPAPRFVVGPNLTPTAPVQFTMGREGRFKVFAEDDNCLDVIKIMGATQSDGTSHLPEGSQILDLPGGLETVCSSAAAEFIWTPSNKHGGFGQSVCFEARDAGGACAGMKSNSAVHCINIAVHRCVYALQFDEQLQDIAARFGTDWMRLWSLNSGLKHPDYIVHMGQDVMVGHMYRIDSNGEMPAAVARRMGMSIQQLKDMNFDVDTIRPLRRGQMLCVIPDSCRGMKSGEVDIKYKDNKMLGESLDQITLPPGSFKGVCLHMYWYAYARFLLGACVYISQTTQVPHDDVALNNHTNAFLPSSKISKFF
jgi:hypothetical protein